MKEPISLTLKIDKSLKDKLAVYCAKEQISCSALFVKLISEKLGIVEDLSLDDEEETKASEELKDVDEFTL